MKLCKLACLVTVALVVLCICQAQVKAGPTTYSGSLQYTPPADSGDCVIVGGNDWSSNTFTVSWVVTYDDTTYPGYPWKYEYTMNKAGGAAGYSHVVIECSEALVFGDITGLSGATFDGTNPTLQTVGSGNPGMPENIYGLRFDPPESGMTDWTWSFYSNRAPVWGDFYAKDGGNPTNMAYNRGFLDPDPTDGPSNDSVDCHILRPDTCTVVPVPGAILLCGFGTISIGLLRRRLTVVA